MPGRMRATRTPCRRCQPGEAGSSADAFAMYANLALARVVSTRRRHRHGRHRRDEARAGPPASRRREQAQARTRGGLRGHTVSRFALPNAAAAAGRVIEARERIVLPATDRPIKGTHLTRE